jgi:hypothetical protein
VSDEAQFAGPPPPDPQSVRLMTWVDGQKPEMRALVHEFGLTIVDQMVAAGARNVAHLRRDLETWRERRQDAWLATDFHISRESFFRKRGHGVAY